MVFVWAFQMRRNRPPPHNPLLEGLLKRPLLAYGIFTLSTARLYPSIRFRGIWIAPEAARPVFLGTATQRWDVCRSLYQSFVHFYYDGLL
jgi:hypothetical protein